MELLKEKNWGSNPHHLNWRMFIDDIRFPVIPEWMIARSPIEALDMLGRYGWPSHISFDFDLGFAFNGKEINVLPVIRDLRAFLESSQEYIPAHFAFSVHSSNPEGAKAIKTEMNNLLKLYQKDAS